MNFHLLFRVTSDDSSPPPNEVSMEFMLGFVYSIGDICRINGGHGNDTPYSVHFVPDSIPTHSEESGLKFFVSIHFHVFTVCEKRAAAKDAVCTALYGMQVKSYVIPLGAGSFLATWTKVCY